MPQYHLPFNRKIKRFFKGQYQRVRYGFSDSDLWNLDITIAEFLVPRLKRFKELNNSYPSNLTASEFNTLALQDGSDNESGFLIWKDKIQTMIDAFEILANDNCFDISRQNDEIVQIGLDNFIKHYRDLWD